MGYNSRRHSGSISLLGEIIADQFMRETIIAVPWCMSSPDMLLWVQWQLCGSPRLQLKSALLQISKLPSPSFHWSPCFPGSIHQHVSWVNLHCVCSEKSWFVRLFWPIFLHLETSPGLVTACRHGYRCAPGELEQVLGAGLFHDMDMDEKWGIQLQKWR